MSQPQLRWLPDSVSKTLLANGIGDRNQLADDLLAFCQLGRATVYRAFNNNWEGRATHVVLAAMQQRFGVPLDLLASARPEHG